MTERYFEDDGKLIIQKTQDPNPTLERVKMSREVGKLPMSDSKHIGTVPGWLVAEWCKEAGVSMSGNHEAVAEVLERKLADGSFAAFRVWEGRF